MVLSLHALENVPENWQISYHKNHEAPGKMVSLSVIFTIKIRHFLWLKMKQVAEDITVKLIGFTYVQGLRLNRTVEHKPIQTGYKLF